MKGHNQITIIGNITNENTLEKYERDGQPNNRLRFSVAVNGYKEGDVDYFNVIAWGKLADALSFLRKGMRVFVSGRMKLDRVSSIENGVDVVKIYPKIVASEIMCLEKKDQFNADPMETIAPPESRDAPIPDAPLEPDNLHEQAPPF